MADLNDPGRNRAQIILLAGFALALIFVAVALVLNSVLFTENLASRGETSSGSEALEVRAMVEANVGDNIGVTNRFEYTSETMLVQKIKLSIENTSDTMERRSVIAGSLLDVTYNASINGSRVNQSDQRAFTAADGSASWTVATDIQRPSGANATRAFEMNVTHSDFATTKADAFRVVASEYKGSNEWAARIWDISGNEIKIEVSRAGAPDISCTPETTRSFVRIDLTEGTVDGDPCRALRTGPSGTSYWFGSGATDRYNLTFRNGDEMRGTYSLVTRNATVDDLTGSSPFVNSPGDSLPHATAALYQVNVNFSYNSSSLNYETNIRVAPGEPDE